VAKQQSFGVRFDYGGEVTIIYHVFHMRPNDGKIPLFFRKLRDRNNGTKTLITTAMVKKDGTKDDVKRGLDEAVWEKSLKR
jgi:hypothetical protein